VVAVLESWENMTLSANDVIVTSSRGNMAVIPCDVSWTSRPPAKLEFQRDSQPPTTLTTSRRQFFHFAIDIYTSFFYRAMLCIRGTSHGPVSVCPFVCPSATSRSSTKTAKHKITQTTSHDSPGSLVF